MIHREVCRGEAAVVHFQTLYPLLLENSANVLVDPNLIFLNANSYRHYHCANPMCMIKGRMWVDNRISAELSVRVLPGAWWNGSTALVICLFHNECLWLMNILQLQIIWICLNAKKIYWHLFCGDCCRHNKVFVLILHRQFKELLKKHCRKDSLLMSKITVIWLVRYSHNNQWHNYHMFSFLAY